MEYVTLNNGMKMPRVGLGTYLIKPEPCEKGVLHALTHGYDLIDSANIYMNERAVGRSIKASGRNREELFITSKIWPSDFKYAKAKKAIDATLNRLGLDYLDLLILHQPAGRYLEAYRALEEAVEEGKIRSIGLSNFYGKDLDKVLANAKIKPVLLTVECHPYCQQKELKARLDKEGILLQSWFPLGQGDKNLAAEPVFNELAKKYNKSPQQIILKWHVQSGFGVIPGSKTPSHIDDNINLFDFELTEDEMNRIRALDKNKKYLGLPNFFVKAFIPLLRLNYEKQE